MTQNNQPKSFADFTNLYEVNKTLRFELKPVGKTEELLKESKVFEKDKLKDDNYHKIKYYFDRLHRQFIKETLGKTVFDLDDYYQKFQNLKKEDRKSSKEFSDDEDKLREKIVENFNKKANDWKDKYNKVFKEQAKLKDTKPIELKQNGIEILFEKDNLEILKEEFKIKPTDDEKAPDIEFFDLLTNKKENLFESFKGFTTYFGNFNNSRRNFYSDKDQTTAVANRIVNENLRVFCNNIKLFGEKKGVYGKIDLTTEEKKIFDLKYYNSCLTQEGIKKYNEMVAKLILV